ncbi:putative ribonuclease H-like domain-containing protein [Tanacetum coccineum]
MLVLEEGYGCIHKISMLNPRRSHSSLGSPDGLLIIGTTHGTSTNGDNIIDMGDGENKKSENYSWKVSTAGIKVNVASYNCCKITTARRISTVRRIKTRERIKNEDYLLFQEKMELVSALVVAAAKLLVLNPNEFELWKMRMEWYFHLMTDYALWEISKWKNELKARGTLLMALPNEHQLKFNTYKSAKSLMEAIEDEVLGGVIGLESSEKLLKLQFEYFNRKITGSTNEAVKIAHGVYAANSKDNASTLPNVDSLSDGDGLEVADGNANNESKEISQEDKKESRECMAPKNQDSRNKEPTRRIVPIEGTTSNALIQVSDKFKTGVGYDSQVFDSQVFDSQMNDKYKTGEGYHVVPPSYTGNFMPPNLIVLYKFDLMGQEEDNAVNKNIVYGYEDDPNMPELEDNSILEYNNPIFDEDEDVSVEKDERGIMVRNKAILVAQGYTQEEGIDYDEVFALAARIEAIRLFLAYALYKDLEALKKSDYAGASLDRKSTTGGCQFLGSRLISWQCKKQTVVANSTTEVEYVAASNCCGQVLWIQNQLLDYGYKFMNTKIFIDNESTICIVKNPVFHSKTKHIEIRHDFIRDSYEKRLIQVIKIHT